jgi:hypothetical protein
MATIGSGIGRFTEPQTFNLSAECGFYLYILLDLFRDVFCDMFWGFIWRQSLSSKFLVSIPITLPVRKNGTINYSA